MYKSELCPSLYICFSETFLLVVGNSILLFAQSQSYKVILSSSLFSHTSYFTLGVPDGATYKIEPESADFSPPPLLISR